MQGRAELGRRSARGARNPKNSTRRAGDVTATPAKIASGGHEMLLRRALVIGCFLLLLAPARAWSDGLIVPFAGVNFGGNAGESLGNGVDAKRFDWGVSFAWMGGGVIGLEGDVGYSPDFYGKGDTGGSSVTSLM